MRTLTQKALVAFFLLSSVVGSYANSWNHPNDLTTMNDYQIGLDVSLKQEFRSISAFDRYESLGITVSNELKVIHNTGFEIFNLAISNFELQPSEAYKKLTNIGDDIFVIETTKGNTLLAQYLPKKRTLEVVNRLQNDQNTTITGVFFQSDSRTSYFTTLDGSVIKYDKYDNEFSEKIKIGTSRIENIRFYEDEIIVSFTNKEIQIYDGGFSRTPTFKAIAPEVIKAIEHQNQPREILAFGVYNNYSIRVDQDLGTLTFNLIKENKNLRNKYFKTSPLQSLFCEYSAENKSEKCFYRDENHSYSIESLEKELLINAEKVDEDLYLFYKNSFRILRSPEKERTLLEQANSASSVLSSSSIINEASIIAKNIDFSIRTNTFEHQLKYLIESNYLNEKEKLEAFKDLTKKNTNYTFEQIIPYFKNANIDQAPFENHYVTVKKSFYQDFLEYLENNDRVGFRNLLTTKVFDSYMPSNFENAIIDNIIKKDNVDFFWDLVASEQNFLDYCNDDNCSPFAKELKIKIDDFLGKKGSQLEDFINRNKKLKNNDPVSTYSDQINKDNVTKIRNQIFINRSFVKNYYANRAQVYRNSLGTKTNIDSRSIGTLLNYGIFPNFISTLLTPNFELDKVIFNYYNINPETFVYYFNDKLFCSPDYQHNDSQGVTRQCLGYDLAGVYAAFNLERKIKELRMEYDHFRNYQMRDYILNPIIAAYHSKDRLNTGIAVLYRFPGLSPKFLYTKGNSSLYPYQSELFKKTNTLDYLKFLSDIGADEVFSYQNTQYVLMEMLFKHTPDGSQVVLDIIKKYKIKAKTINPENKRQDLSDLAKDLKLKIYREALKQNK